MTLLRSALGDPSATACGHCDICHKPQPIAPFDISPELRWISIRPVPIAAAKMQRLSQGLSLLDGKLRTPPFLHFMKGRAVTEEVDPEILSLLLEQASFFNFHLAAIVLLPSKTWKAQMNFAKAFAAHLNVPLFPDLLVWKTVPEKRQGEFFNNDQRHHNVHEKMGVNLPVEMPSGALILFDDYIGSGMTIKEAARCLRKVFDQPLVPLTVAAVKWRLGKQGFV